MNIGDRPPYPGSPLWAKLCRIIMIVVLLLFLILMITRGSGGDYGPDRHAPSGDAGVPNSLSSITEVNTPPAGDR